MNKFKRSFVSKIIIILSILSLNLLFSCNQKSTRKIIQLNDGWEFYYAPEDKWYPAHVPGNIHTDLYQAGLIDNPFLGNNADSLNWISQTKWQYRKDFTIAKLFYNRNLELVFDGLDTYCDIILNGDTIGNTYNMYRQWVFPIDDSVKKENNHLELVFYPTDSINRVYADTKGYAIPDDRVFTRKAPYHYGWDWAPELNSCGIYKSVYINSWEKLRISNISLEQKYICDTMATLVANIELESENYYNGNVIIYSPTHEFDTLETKLEIFEGKQTYPVEFGIRDPQLWWCNGMGEAKMYDIVVEVSTKFRVEKQELKTGLRTIDLITSTDPSGQQFTFVLNGIPVFARGANWVPAEYFNGSNTSENYYEFLSLAKDANFNMLRVWGGGIYENDDFYNICDSLGIMVWQDFMFSCAMYPLDEKQIENITEEVKYQVKRLNNHPAIVMWCGNNEISNAWFDWEWQDQYNISTEDSLEIWNDYDNLFHRIIPKTIAEIDKSRKYIPSSPFYGWGHKESITHGDNHYWGVWWGMLDFEEYWNNTGRFMSEYGFQGIPNMKSLKKFIPADSLFLYSESLKSHQKHPFGFEAIQKYMENYYPVPKDFGDYVYISQIMQAEGLQEAFDAHISSRPYCMGSLFWQFNDCWPSISWSAVDYYKNPKALYYFAKRSFENIHATMKNEEGKITFSITNHNNITINTKVVCNVKDFDGKLIHADSLNVMLDLLRTTDIGFYHTPDSVFLNNQNNSFVEISIENFETEKVIYKRNFVVGKPKNLQLNKSDFHFNIQKKKTSWEVTLKSKNYVYNLFLYSENNNGRFSDNYFDLIPGEKKVVNFYPEKNNNEMNLKFKSLNNIIDQTQEENIIDSLPAGSTFPEIFPE